MTDKLDIGEIRSKRERGRTMIRSHRKASAMSRVVGVMCGGWLLLGMVSGAGAQYVVNYPPADGYFTSIPPSYPAPGAVGGQYLETFPSFAGTYDSTGALAQPTVPYATQTAPVVPARVRNARARRAAARGYSQAPAPYATPLPQGQLYWPGSYVTPYYVPGTRYQTYGSGYGRGPYGSNFYPGYYKGFVMASPSGY